ncbi:trypsin-like serine protease [Actinosynnema sp. NPDC051121]|nr:trypsin-like serine protease [Saccharothrix sp.]
MRTATVAAAVVALAAVTASPASAINTYNAVPAPERTEVGALVATWDNDDDPTTPDRVDWVCSGTMVDADTFLTAAHCVNDWPSNVKFYVSLSQDVQSALDAATGTPAQKAAAVGVPGVAHDDPAYPGNSADAHDIAVIELPAKQVAARWSFKPATLPTAGKLGTMSPKALDATEYTVVGYGTEEAQNGPGGQTHPGGGVRMKASLGFNALNNTWLRLSMIEAQGNGGACYGDSGGPNFATLDGKRVLVATTITGDAPCYATNVVYRLDTPSARSFLAPFVALP